MGIDDRFDLCYVPFSLVPIQDYRIVHNLLYELNLYSLHPWLDHRKEILLNKKF